MVYSIVGPFLKTRDDEDDNDSDDSDDDIDNIFIKFVNHPSIKAIRPNFNITSKFSLQVVSVNDVKEVIKDLKSNIYVDADLSINILKIYIFTFTVLHFLYRPITLINLLKMVHFLTA